MRLFFLLLSIAAALAAIPTPQEHFGHEMGEDRRLVPWQGVVDYFRKLEAASPSLQVAELGPTTEGRPLIAVTIADAQTISDLDRFRAIQAGLADPRATPPDAAAQLVLEGKPVVLITCSIHSNEVASTLAAVQFAHDLLTKDTPRHRAILQNTILLLVPSLNPDGVDKVRSWYRRWLGGPYEGAPMTELYHKYVGHDNNRDWYIFTQQETRLVVEQLHNAWHPQVVYDVHQMRTDGPRIFVPPWVDPIDANIDPLIVQQVNAFGTAMAVDLTASGKRGVLVHGIYDYFSPSRHYQSYHGGLRLLSESASANFATPVFLTPEQLDRKTAHYDVQSRSWNFVEPWEGGEWRLRDIVDNQLITFESVLYSAALRRQDLLRNFYRIGQRVIQRGRGHFFVIPREQHDPNAATHLLQTLRFGQVDIERFEHAGELGGERVAAGDFLVRLDQPYGAFAKTLLELQDYPDLRTVPGAPPHQPYDATAHSLPLLMGVRAFAVQGEVDTPTRLEPHPEVATSRVADAAQLELSPRFSAAWAAVSRLLGSGVAVHRNQLDGAFLVEADAQLRQRLQRLAEELKVAFEASPQFAADHPRLTLPRVAIYAGHVPSMDEGWTRWLLDRFEFPYDSVGDAEVRRGLSGHYDALILPDALPAVLDAGFEGAPRGDDKPVPPAYRGALGQAGAEALKQFAGSGGTILAFNRAARYAADKLGLPVEDMLDGISRKRFYGPGTLVNVAVDPRHPLCFGMRSAEAVWFQFGPAFRVRRQATASVHQPLRYPARGLLASGWLIGPGYLANRAAVADVRVGRGRVILFGIRPQYRGQSYATFKMVFNGLFL